MPFSSMIYTPVMIYLGKYTGKMLGLMLLKQAAWVVILYAAGSLIWRRVTKRLVAWRLAINGDFDRYMLRPMNIFFQVIAEKLQPDALGELLTGTILVAGAVAKGIVIIDAVHIGLFLVSVLAGALIYTAIKLFFASLAFWVSMKVQEINALPKERRFFTWFCITET